MADDKTDADRNDSLCADVSSAHSCPESILVALRQVEELKHWGGRGIIDLFQQIQWQKQASGRQLHAKKHSLTGQAAAR